MNDDKAGEADGDANTNQGAGGTAASSLLNSQDSKKPSFLLSTGPAKETKNHTANMVAYVSKELKDARYDEEEKRQNRDLTRTAALAARQRSRAATATIKNLTATLEASWRQSVKPSALTFNQLRQKWLDRLRDMPAAKLNVPTSVNAAKQAKRALCLAKSTVEAAQSAHEAARMSVLLPSLDCDYGALVAAEKNTGDKLRLALEGEEAARERAVTAKQAAKRMACLVDVETVERYYLSQQVTAAYKEYASAKSSHDEIAAQVTAAKAAEEAGKAAEQAAKIQCIQPHREYLAAHNRTRRARKTLCLARNMKNRGKKDSAVRSGSGGGGAAPTAAEDATRDQALGGLKRGAGMMGALESQVKNSGKVRCRASSIYVWEVYDAALKVLVLSEVVGCTVPYGRVMCALYTSKYYFENVRAQQRS